MAGPEAARQAEINRFCSDSRVTRGGTDAVASCVRAYADRPEVKLPSPADVPLPGERAYDPAPAVVEAALTNDHGIKTVTGIINNAIQTQMILDTGASLIQLPLPIAEKLAELGTLSLDDVISQDTFTTADGHQSVKPVIRLHSLTVGGVTLHDVEASIGTIGSPLLLGQSFLGRLGSWAIDNKTGVLRMQPVGNA
jgi:clan AA aspartic protease (TIGR02281 family)